MSSYNNIFGGTVVQTSEVSYKAIALSASISLSWPTQFQDTNNVVAHIMDVTPSANGFTITLPDATQTSVGQDMVFFNASGSHSFIVADNSGNVLATPTNGQTFYLYLTDNTTTAGNWRLIPFGGGVAAITSINATSLDPHSNVYFTGSPALPITTAGTIQLNLRDDLLALTGFEAETGYSVRTAANTWALRKFSGTNNQIVLTNPDGIAGNTVIGLATNITGPNSITVGNINLSTNVISSVSANSSLVLSPNGTGSVQFTSDIKLLDGKSSYFYDIAGDNYIKFSAGVITGNSFNLSWPTSEPAISQVLACTGGISPNWNLNWADVTTYGGTSIVNSLPKFTNTSGSLGDTAVLVDDLNNMTGVTSITLAPVNGLSFGVGTPNVIASIGVNTDIIVTPNGSGNLIVSGLNFPNSANTNQSFSSVLMNNGLNTLVWTSIINRNLLRNGAMNIWQRNTSFSSGTTFFPNNNGQYTADGWMLISDGNNVVNVTRGTGPTGSPFGTAYSLLSTVQTAGAGLKFGFCQFLESTQSSKINNNNVSFSFSANANGITNIRVALIAWTGTADQPSNPISVWGASGTNPTLSAGWAYVAGYTPVNIALTGTYARYRITNVQMSTATNFGVMIWVDDTTAVSSSTLNLCLIQLEIGQSDTLFDPLPAAQEVMLCKRYFQKDLTQSTVIGVSGIASASSTYVYNGATIANGITYAIVRLWQDMLNTPNITTYSIDNGAGGVTSTSSSASSAPHADYGANSANPNVIDSTTFTVTNTSGSPLVLSAPQSILFHWYATDPYF